MGILYRASSWTRWAVREAGIRGAVRMGLAELLRPIRPHAKRPRAHPFDETYGVETSGWIPRSGYRSGHPGGEFSTGYYGVPPSLMTALLRRWLETTEIQSTSTCSFWDIGCGKGRAMLLASEIPFREVVGVEIDPDLAQTSDRNAENWRAAGRAKCPIRIIAGDVSELELPKGPMLAYLFNPFHPPVLRSFLTRLVEREEATEILHCHCKYEGVYLEFPALQRVWKERLRIGETDVAADGISAAEELCALYRLKHQASNF